jgi:hypothetical protein
MVLNDRQMKALWAGLAIVLLITIYPPWKCTYRIVSPSGHAIVDTPTYEMFTRYPWHKPARGWGSKSALEVWFPKRDSDSKNSDVKAIALLQNLDFAFTLWLAQVVAVGLVTVGLLVTFDDRGNSALPATPE